MIAVAFTIFDDIGAATKRLIPQRRQGCGNRSRRDPARSPSECSVRGSAVQPGASRAPAWTRLLEIRRPRCCEIWPIAVSAMTRPPSGSSIPRAAPRCGARPMPSAFATGPTTFAPTRAAPRSPAKLRSMARGGVGAALARLFGPGPEVLYRRVRGRDDHCGDRNHWASVNDLMAPDRLAARLQRDLRLPRRSHSPCASPGAQRRREAEHMKAAQ